MPECPREIFAERFDIVLAHYARRTHSATKLLTAFALQAGGEGGARLARASDLFGTVLTLGRAEAMREQTIALAELHPGERVLEVGCGTAEVAQRARVRVGPDGHVIGIDPSANMIDVARKKAARAGLDIDCRVGAIETLPYPDASFDVVLSSLMMNHLPDDLKSMGLAEVRRVLEPGGWLLIVDFRRPRNRFSRLAMRLLLHANLGRGFEHLAGGSCGSGLHRRAQRRDALRFP